MSAAADLGPDTAAEHVFASVTVSVAAPGARGLERAGTTHLTLVGATPLRRTPDVAADGDERRPPQAAPRSRAGDAARIPSHGGDAGGARSHADEVAPSGSHAGDAATPPAQAGDPAPRSAAEPPVPGPARWRPSATGTTPRVRLVPAPPAARPLRAMGPAGGPPPLLAERIRVLRVDDRSLDLDELDERGAPPAADPSVVARRVAGASVEVIVGRRPAGQLARWVAPGVLDVLRTRAAFTRHATSPAPTRAPTVRGVRVCALHEHLVEATAVVDDGRRVRAVAIRLETHRGAWRATALEVG